MEDGRWKMDADVNMGNLKTGISKSYSAKLVGRCTLFKYNFNLL